MAVRIRWLQAQSAFFGREASVRTHRMVNAGQTPSRWTQRSLQCSRRLADLLELNRNSVSWESTLYATVIGRGSLPTEQWFGFKRDAESVQEQPHAGVNAAEGDLTVEPSQNTLPLAHPTKLEETSANVTIKLEDAPAVSGTAKSERRSGLPMFPSWIDKISKGQILEPMTRFLEVAAQKLEGARTEQAQALTADVMNNIVQALAKTATTPRYLGRGVTQKAKSSKAVWVPYDKNLFPDSRNQFGDFEGLPPATLAFVSLLHVYDIAASFGLRLSVSALASLLRALPYHAPVRVYDQCLALVLLQQNGVDFRRAQLQAQQGWEELDREDYARASIHIIAAAIHGYGVLGQRKKGETLLGRWSLVQPPTDHPHVSSPPVNERKGQTFPSGPWRDHLGTWSALIDSRARNNDLPAAKHWLQQYRHLLREDGLVSQPYYQYMRHCASSWLSRTQTALKLGKRAKGQTLRRTLMLEVLQMLGQDGVAMDEQLLSLVINSEVGFGNLREAAQAICTTVLDGHLKANLMPPSFYKAIFRLYAQHYLRHKHVGGPFKELRVDGKCPGWCPFTDLRQLFCAFASRYRIMLNKGEGHSARDACTHALVTSFIVGDLPLALVVMQHMASFEVPVKRDIHIPLLRWLSQNEDGFGARRPLHTDMGRHSFLPLHLYPTDPRDIDPVTVSEEGDMTLVQSDGFKSSLPGLNRDMPFALRTADVFVQLALIGLVRRALQEGVEKFSPWVQAVFVRLQVKGLDDSTTTRSDIMLACVEDVLCEPNGGSVRRPVRIKHLEKVLELEEKDGT